jgi:hypothetical protein
MLTRVKTTQNTRKLARFFQKWAHFYPQKPQVVLT